jgi:predicted nucleic acid-binding protein
MSAEFVDSNILVYAHDPTTPAKHDRAQSLVERLWLEKTGRLSIQVMQEFFWIVTRKIPAPLP